MLISAPPPPPSLPLRAASRASFSPKGNEIRGEQSPISVHSSLGALSKRGILLRGPESN